MRPTGGSKAPAPFREEWAKLREADRRALIWFSAFGVGLITLAWFLEPFLPSIWYRFLLYVPLLLGVVALHRYLGKFICPKCGKQVFVRGKLPPEFGFHTGSCPHCGLQIGPRPR